MNSLQSRVPSADGSRRTIWKRKQVVEKEDLPLWSSHSLSIIFTAAEVELYIVIKHMYPS